LTLSTLESHLTSSWERRLFALAHEPLEHSEPPLSVQADAETLERAYRHCVAVTQEYSKTFYLASALMPPAKRRAVRALYAFCRVSDDLVDQARPNASGGDRLAQLEGWRARALSGHPVAGGFLAPIKERPAAAKDMVALAWADTRARFCIPTRYAHQLIDGVAWDLCKTRYATFDELAEYAYGVASTVGLMSMHITGFCGREAIPYAVKLGVALQLTNILRDVGEDWANGRLYLPQDELAAFGLREEDIATGPVDDRWRALMRFQIERNRRLYDEALPGIDMLHAEGRFAIAAAGELYRGILENIEANDYQVFKRRAHVTGWGKLRRLPGIWWRARTGYGKDSH
jgi:phytoene synthase